MMEKIRRFRSAIRSHGESEASRQFLCRTRRDGGRFGVAATYEKLIQLHVSLESGANSTVIDPTDPIDQHKSVCIFVGGGRHRTDE